MEERHVVCIFFTSNLKIFVLRVSRNIKDVYPLPLNHIIKTQHNTENYKDEQHRPHQKLGVNPGACEG
jgi:hypothetical protein